MFLLFYQKTLGIEFKGMVWLFIKVVQLHLNTNQINVFNSRCMNLCLAMVASILEYIPKP